MERQIPNMEDTLKAGLELLAPAKYLDSSQTFTMDENGTLGTNKGRLRELQDDRDRVLQEALFVNTTPVASHNTQMAAGINKQAQLQNIAFEAQRAEDDASVRSNLISSVFKGEGGYSTDKKDTGNYYEGAFVGTNHGISAPILAEALGRTPTAKDMKALTQDQANDIFINKYYKGMGIDTLPPRLQEIALHGVVNSGGHAIKVMQKLLGVQADGVAGPNTRKAMSEAEFTKNDFAEALLKKYKTFKTWDTHGKGWTNRFRGLAK